MRGPRLVWIVVALLVIVLTQGSVMAVRGRYEPQHVRELKGQVEELPATLGTWQVLADEVEDADSIDDQVLNRLRTDEAMSRTYVHPSGQTCGIHIAVWRDPEEWTPHPPEMCYKSAGFNKSASTLVEVPGRDKQRVRSVEFVAANTGQAVAVIYWYQIGTRTYVDRDSGRSIRRDLWGNAERPPMVKVLLQSNESDSDDDERDLLELAGQIHKFAAEL